MMVQTLLSFVILTTSTPPEGVVSFQGGRGFFRVLNARTLPRAHLGVNLVMEYRQAKFPRDTMGLYDPNGSFKDKHHYGEATFGMTYSVTDFFEFFTRGDFYVKYDEQEGSRVDEYSWYIQEGAIGLKTGGVVLEDTLKGLSWSPGIYGLVTLTPSKGPDDDSLLFTRGFLPFQGHDPDGELGFLMDFTIHPLSFSTNLGYLSVGKSKENFLGVRGDRSHELHLGGGIEIETGPYVRWILEVVGERLLNEKLREIYPDTIHITPGLRFVSNSGVTFDFGVDVALVNFDFIPDIEPTPGESPIWNAFMGFSVTSSLLKKPEAPPIATLTGKIIDAESREPLGAELTFTGTEQDAITSDPETGIFKVTLTPGSIRVRVSKEGYRWQEKGAQLKKDGSTILDFALEKKKIAISLITGRVIDARSRAPMGAMISVPELKDVKPVATDLETGIFKIRVSAGTHNVKAEAEGYDPVVAPVVVAENQTVIQNFTLKPKTKTPPPPPPPPPPKKKVEVGQRIVFRGIYFRSGSSRIDPRSYPILDDASRMLKDNSTVKVEIQGHTDSVGESGYNLSLSQARANAVRSYLIGLGISGQRMVARGYGEDMPVASNRTRDGRSENRRIEFLILSR